MMMVPRRLKAQWKNTVKTIQMNKFFLNLLINFSSKVSEVLYTKNFDFFIMKIFFLRTNESFYLLKVPGTLYRKYGNTLNIW